MHEGSSVQFLFDLRAGVQLILFMVSIKDSSSGLVADKRLARRRRERDGGFPVRVARDGDN
jgi:hypothetical protein